MGIEQKVRERLLALVEEGNAIAAERPPQYAIPFDVDARCKGWFASSEHLLSLICAKPSDPYRIHAAEALEEYNSLGSSLHVMTLTDVLKRISLDIDSGLITSVADAASAETLDDLLDQAKEYHRRSHKEGSGILATAVYEDTIRRIARAHNITEAKVSTDQIISDLVNANVISPLVAKLCRFASGVRNHALHAQWNEFTLAEVDQVIRLTGQLLVDHLDG